jgi:hypothetical protein
MRFVNRGLALIFAFLVSTAVPVAIFSTASIRVIQQPNAYYTVADNPATYEVVLDNFFRPNPNAANSAINWLTLVGSKTSPEVAHQVAESLLPRDWLSGQLRNVINVSDEWLRNSNVNQPIPDAAINFQTIRALWQSPDSSGQAAEMLVDDLPSCSATELLLLASYADKRNTRTWASQDYVVFPTCKPETDEARAITLDVLTSEINKLGEILPTEWDLPMLIQGRTDQETQDAIQTFIGIRGIVRGLTQLSIGLFLVPFGIFALVIIFAVRSRRGFFAWTAGVCLLAGLFTLTPTIVSTFNIFNVFQQRAVENRLTQELGDQIFAGIAIEFLEYVDSQVSLASIISTIVLVAIGFAGLFFTVISPKPPRFLRARDLRAAQTTASN